MSSIFTELLAEIDQIPGAKPAGSKKSFVECIQVVQEIGCVFLYYNVGNDTKTLSRHFADWTGDDPNRVQREMNALPDR